MARKQRQQVKTQDSSTSRPAEQTKLQEANERVLQSGGDSDLAAALGGDASDEAGQNESDDSQNETPVDTLAAAASVEQQLQQQVDKSPAEQLQQAQDDDLAAALATDGESAGAVSKAAAALPPATVVPTLRGPCPQDGCGGQLRSTSVQKMKRHKIRYLSCNRCGQPAGKEVC